MADSENKSKGRPQPDQKIIKEGGYQPTSDPGPVPTSLVRPATDKPSDTPKPPADKK